MRYVDYEPSPKEKLPELELTVRRFEGNADIEAAAILSGLYTDESPDDALPNARKHAFGSRNTVYVACLPSGEVIAYARITWVGIPAGAPANVAPAGYYLGGMVVSDKYRRRGVGRRLTEARMQQLRETVDEAWYLVNTANVASFDLHLEHGFHETTRDFVFPGVVYDNPDGILCHTAFTSSASSCPGCPSTMT